MLRKIDLNNPEFWELPPPVPNMRGRPPSNVPKGKRLRTPYVPKPAPPAPLPVPILVHEHVIKDEEDLPPQQPTSPFIEEPKGVKLSCVFVTAEVAREIVQIAKSANTRKATVVTELILRGLADYRTSAVLTFRAVPTNKKRKGRWRADPKNVPFREVVLPTASAKQFNRPRPKLGEED